MTGSTPTPDLPPGPEFYAAIDRRPIFITAILRLPLSSLDGRPTPARVAEIERAAAEGLVPEFLAAHLTRSGHVDDETWRLLAYFWEEGAAFCEDEW